MNRPATIGGRHPLRVCVAAIAAAFLFHGCRTAPPRILGPQPHPPPRILLDSGTPVGPAPVATAGWIEWVAPDGRTVVIELARAADPPHGRAWWVRDHDLTPLALLVIQPPRQGRRIGARVTQGRARVGAEVLATDPAVAPKIPPLQNAGSR